MRRTAHMVPDNITELNGHYWLRDVIKFTTWELELIISSSKTKLHKITITSAEG